MRALLLIAHGSRRVQSNDEIEALANLLAVQPGNAFDTTRHAFLVTNGKMDFTMWAPVQYNLMFRLTSCHTEGLQVLYQHLQAPYFVIFAYLVDLVDNLQEVNQHLLLCTLVLNLNELHQK